MERPKAKTKNKKIKKNKQTKQNIMQHIQKVALFSVKRHRVEK